MLRVTDRGPADVALKWMLAQCCSNGVGERWEIPLTVSQISAGIYSIIGVTQPLAHSADFVPRLLRHNSVGVFTQSNRGFAYAL